MQTIKIINFQCDNKLIIEINGTNIEEFKDDYEMIVERIHSEKNFFEWIKKEPHNDWRGLIDELSSDDRHEELKFIYIGDEKDFDLFDSICGDLNSAREYKASIDIEHVKKEDYKETILQEKKQEENNHTEIEQNQLDTTSINEQGSSIVDNNEKPQDEDENNDKESLKTDNEKCASFDSIKKAKAFYDERIVLVYKDSYKDIASYFKDLLNENRVNVESYLENNLFPVNYSLDEYNGSRHSLEETGAHLIFLGDSKESRKIYKHANCGRWDYYNLGMRFVSTGKNTVILARKIKNKEINELIRLAQEISPKFAVEIPDDVETVKYRSMIKELYDENLKGEDTVVKAAAGVAGTLLLPGLVFGEVLGVAITGIQSLQNKISEKEIKFLQCSIAFYKYLESVGAWTI